MCSLNSLYEQHRETRPQSYVTDRCSAITRKHDRAKQQESSLGHCLLRCFLHLYRQVWSSCWFFWSSSAAVVAAAVMRSQEDRRWASRIWEWSHDFPEMMGTTTFKSLTK
ncbi:hypothetical protein F2P79_003280 [Pimephales promelas]|nr:hypothetical protein F2P79_003280 [Pimephales promelas]